MKIAIDLRSLSTGNISGVENYILNLLDNLFGLDQKNQYILFNNGFSKSVLGDFHYVNTTRKSSRVPSKFLNLALKFNFLKLEKLIGDFDCLFLPNLNQFNVNPKVKVILTVHDLSPVITPEFYNFKRRFWHKFLNYKKAFDRANILIAVSENTKKDLIKLFNINPEKIKVIYPGMDQNFFQTHISEERLRMARNIYNLPGEYILFLNTIEPRKNLSGLIKAYESLPGNAHLVIVGRPGWKYQDVFNEIKQSVKSSRIKYIGYIEEKHKPAVIKLAKVLAYPSFYEGFGFQPLEAMSVGTPVVASQVTSIPEIVGNAGLLFNPYNINDIASALNTALYNEPVRRVLIQNGEQRLGQFVWKNTANQLLQILNTR